MYMLLPCQKNLERFWVVIGTSCLLTHVIVLFAIIQDCSVEVVLGVPTTPQDVWIQGHTFMQGFVIQEP